MIAHASMFQRFSVLCLTASAVLLAACGRGDLPPLGQVSGTVTMDGKPLSDVTVQFSPEAGGRTSVGITDQNGVYQLAYTSDAMGAQVGKHTARLLPGAVAPSDDAMDLSSPSVSIPPEAMEKTFEFDVVSGKNTFDIQFP